MSTGYVIASLVIVVLGCTVWLASQRGWGLPSEAAARAQAARSVRTGSVYHRRSYWGGGPGWGK